MKTNQLTKIANLPGSGGGCMSALPAEVVEQPAPVPAGAPAAITPPPPATHTEATITMETMAELGRNLDRMKSREAARRQGFESFEYTERN